MNDNTQPLSDLKIVLAGILTHIELIIKTLPADDRLQIEQNFVQKRDELLSDGSLDLALEHLLELIVPLSSNKS